MHSLQSYTKDYAGDKPGIKLKRGNTDGREGRSQGIYAKRDWYNSKHNKTDGFQFISDKRVGNKPRGCSFAVESDWVSSLGWFYGSIAILTVIYSVFLLLVQKG